MTPPIDQPGSLPYALYNPALLPPELLLAEFTARRPLLSTLLNIIRANLPGHPPQHVLLIGPRGMGKTTLLWAVAHTITLREPDLRQQWQPVVFDEESRRIGDLADFWLECLRQWEFATGDRSRRAAALLARPGSDLEDRARETFLSVVGSSGRRALLLIDNLNDIFASIHDPEPLHRLRAFLMEESRVMLIGGATRWFDDVTSLDKPFFEFFRPFELKPLTLEEMRACLLALAETRGDQDTRNTLEQRDGTVQALHLLTGGNPRLVKTFYRLLRDGLRTDIRTDLEKLLDEFTPYFKAIIDALPGQQQRVLDALALHWDPCDVATVALATRLPSNQVSAQIRALGKAGLVSEVAAASTGKKKAYLLTDRFSNIHYLMRHGRAARNRLDWFVALVRVIFPDRRSTDILVQTAREAAACGPDGLADARSVMYSAWLRSDSVASRRELVHAAVRESWNSEALAYFEQWIDPEMVRDEVPEIDLVALCKHLPDAVRQKLGYKPDDAGWWHQLADLFREIEAWSPAEAAYRKVIALDPKAAAPWHNLGNLLQDHLQRFEDAEFAYRTAIDLDPQNARPWNGLGTLFEEHLQRSTEAEAAYRKAIQLDPKYVLPWIGLGNLLQDQVQRSAEAEAAYRKAIEMNPNQTGAWIGLGILLATQLQRATEAEAAFRRAIDLDPNDGYSWNNLGNLLAIHLRRPEEAETAYRRAIELNPKNAYPRHGLGTLLQVFLDRPKEAEAAYREAIELNSAYAKPWSALADLLNKRGGSRSEARACAVTGLQLEPSYGFARRVFLHICGDQADDWRAVLPSLLTGCVAHPQAMEVFDFTTDGLLRFARLQSVAEALRVLDTLAEADLAPFETIRDAFIAQSDRDHLHRLAPERRMVVIELLARLEAGPKKR